MHREVRTSARFEQNIATMLLFLLSTLSLLFLLLLLLFLMLLLLLCPSQFFPFALVVLDAVDVVLVLALAVFVSGFNSAENF